MQQRISLARSLAHEPRVLFLDEPFTGLDARAAVTLRGTLQQLKRSGRTAIMATHDLTQGLELSDRWIVLARGRIVAQGRSSSTNGAAFEREYFERFTAPAATRTTA